MKNSKKSKTIFGLILILLIILLSCFFALVITLKNMETEKEQEVQVVSQTIPQTTGKVQRFK